MSRYYLFSTKKKLIDAALIYLHIRKKYLKIVLLN